jgi:hypothetical protein
MGRANPPGFGSGRVKGRVGPTFWPTQTHAGRVGLSQSPTRGPAGWPDPRGFCQEPAGHTQYNIYYRFRVRILMLRVNSNNLCNNHKMF